MISFSKSIFPYSILVTFPKFTPPLFPVLPAVVAERVEELDGAGVGRQGEVADDGVEDDEGCRDENPRCRNLEHLS